MKLVLRIRIRIEARALKARRFSWRSVGTHINSRAPTVLRGFSRYGVDREKCSTCKIGRCHVRHGHVPNIPVSSATRGANGSECCSIVIMVYVILWWRRFPLLIVIGWLCVNTALASLVVTNTNSQGAGSLFDALATANQTSASKTITFNRPGNGPWTITTTTLWITAPVVIDGTSQPGYDGAFNRVYVEGSTGVSSVFFLTQHSGTTIKGIGIYNYDNNGVTIWKDAHWNFVDDCYIGFKKTATGILPNTARAQFCAGIGIQGNYNKVRRTTISGVYNGINMGEAIEQPTTGLVTHDNLLEYNRIGTDPTGQTTVGYGNTSTGIFMGAGVQSSWIGGYNVIAGNGGSGVEILHPSDFGNRIYYNYLGVNDGGTKVIDGPTNNQGILIGNVAKNNGAWGNVASGNRLAGIIVSSGDGNWIWNNTIGLNQSQTQAIGGQNSGIVVNVDTDRAPGVSAVRNSIQGNMVCNHYLNAIEIYSGVGNGVYNNWIGMNSAGQPFANVNWGVYLQDSSYNTGSGNAWGSNGLGRVGQVGG